jgi:GSCFA family
VKPSEIDDYVRWTGDMDRSFISRNPTRWITKNTKIFSIGSCFAVNLTRWLKEQGVNTRLPVWGLHYNPATILSEFRRAVGVVDEDVIWELSLEDGSTCFVDAKRHPISANSLAELNVERHRISKTSEECFEAADGFIITLGLSEIWEQIRNNGIDVINRAPDKRIIANIDFNSRFLSVDECVEYIRQIVDLIRLSKGHDTPIIFSVSPIPLKGSASNLDVQTANIRSKAILIASIHLFIDEDSNRQKVSYFPAYEIISGGWRPQTLWQHDHRHLNAWIIDRVCMEFVNTFACYPEQFSTNPNFQVPLV